VTRNLPTAHFASLVYGPGGVSPDDQAEAFHEASRLYPNVAPPRHEVMFELMHSSELAETVARASRTHDHRPAVELPAATRLPGRLDDAIARRRSVRADVLRPVRLATLATVLGASYRARPTAEGALRRPVPSAGALYPLELYVISVAVDGLDPGVYHYHPFRHRLHLIGMAARADLRAAVVEPSILETAAALLVVTAVFWRSRFKYGARGYRFALLEAGHLVQNAVLAASELDLPAVPLGGFYDRLVDRLVGADGLDESAVYCVVLGGAS
jgi:SagB-type dehydrogenase family enzyme